MRLVDLSETAERDLLDICRFLGPSLAGEQFLEAVLRARDRLQLFAMIGSTDHVLAPGKRVVGLTRGYLLSYEVLTDEHGDERVIIRRIFHGARRPGSID